MLQRHLVILTSLTLAIGGGAKKLWSKEPADVQNIILSSYPVGNGKLGGKKRDDPITPYLPRFS